MLVAIVIAMGVFSMRMTGLRRGYRLVGWCMSELNSHAFESGQMIVK